MRALLLIVCFLPGHSQTKNDLEKQNLKGRVKSVIQCQFPVSLGRADTGWSTIYVFKYNDFGNQAEDADYTGGSLLTGFGKLNHRRDYTYDANGNQAEVSEYTSDGALSQKVLYDYNDEGRRVSRKNYTPDGALWRRTVFSYDEKGNETASNKYTADSTLLQQIVYKYDDRGDPIQEMLYVYRLSDTAHGFINLADPDKVVRVDYIKEFTYDDSGKMVMEVNNIYGTAFPFTTSFNYVQYDMAGNWVREEFIEGGKLTNIVERVIDYY